MKVGFIGAGNVGSCLGRYFIHHNIPVIGYYSRTKASAQEAAKQVEGEVFDSVDKLLENSDVLFITVPDDAIASVWDEIRTKEVQGKFICHCSGSLSSTILSGSEEAGTYGYSIHPMFPFNSKTIEYDVLSKAVFSVEGDETHKEEMLSFLRQCPNVFVSIEEKDKAKYHVAAVFASNLMVGLMDQSVGLLKECGFSEQEALSALKPLAYANLDNIFQVGTMDALTGPVERGDIKTVEKHRSVLNYKYENVYEALTDVIIDIATKKNPQMSYEGIRKGVQDEANS